MGGIRESKCVPWTRFRRRSLIRLFSQRACSSHNTRSSARTATRPRRHSTRRLKRPHSPSSRSSAPRGSFRPHLTFLPTLTVVPLRRMDYMYNACSTTARRGALDWAPVFEAANRPVFEKLYKSVRDGTETRKALEFNGRSTYRQDLARELKEIDEQEIWRAGKTVRSLRPDYKP